MTLVIDASLVVSALVDAGDTGRWAESLLTRPLSAPHLMPVEVTDILRRAELRDNVTSYDAWYIALAESLGSSVATLDRRMAKAPGPRCNFEIPPAMT